VNDYNILGGNYTGIRSQTYGSLWFANGPTPVGPGEFGDGYFLDSGPVCLIAVPGGLANLFSGYSAGPATGTWSAGPGSEFRVTTAKPDLFNTDYQSLPGAVGLQLVAGGRRRGILLSNLPGSIYNEATPYRQAVPNTASMGLLYVRPDSSFDWQYNLLGGIYTVPLTNPYKNISFTLGTYVHAVYLERHWEVVAADCPDPEPESTT
jgi:hypothetical protein